MRSAAYAAAWKPQRATLLAVRAFSESGGKRKPVSHMAKAVRGDVARALLLAKKAPADPEAAAAVAREAGFEVELTGSQPRRHRLAAEAEAMRGQARPGGGPRSSRGRVWTSTSPSAAIVSRLERLDLGRLVGPGGEDDRGDLEAGGAGRLDRQQRVVDRAEAGRGGDDQRVAEVDREVADQVVAAASGTSRPPTPSQTSASAPAAAARATSSSRSGSISSPAIAAARCGEAGGP